MSNSSTFEIKVPTLYPPPVNSANWQTWQARGDAWTAIWIPQLVVNHTHCGTKQVTRQVASLITKYVT